MWAFYKKQFVRNQIVIAIVLVGLFLLNKYQYNASLEDIGFKMALFFVVMELMMFPGAWWGARIQRRIEEARERLPLDKR